jgi:hypothetical protein
VPHVQPLHQFLADKRAHQRDDCTKYPGRVQANAVFASHRARIFEPLRKRLFVVQIEILPVKIGECGDDDDAHIRWRLLPQRKTDCGVEQFRLRVRVSR